MHVAPDQDLDTITPPKLIGPTILLENALNASPKPCDLVVIIPAYNEESGVRQTVERVRAALADEPCRFEIIVVDDGSTDDTAMQAESAHIRVIRLRENRGYGAALKAGIAASSSEHVAILDADGTYPAEMLPRLLEHARGADMVVGARSGSNSNIPLVRRPAKWILNRLGGFLAGQRIPDINSGLRVMRRSSLRRFLPLLPSGFSFTTTITLAMLCTECRVVYLPIDYHPRLGTSKIRPAHFTSFLFLILRTVLMFNPLKVFLPLGLVVFVVGLAKLVQDILLWNLSETAVLCFLTAIIVWSVGMQADMTSLLHLRRTGEPE